MLKHFEREQVSIVERLDILEKTHIGPSSIIALENRIAELEKGS
jgi:hypothetical protein